MSKAKSFCIPGQKVTIKANPAHASPRQRAKYMGTSGGNCHIVCLDRKYRNNDHEDGLREVSSDLIEELGCQHALHRRDPDKVRGLKCPECYEVLK